MDDEERWKKVRRKEEGERWTEEGGKGSQSSHALQGFGRGNNVDGVTAMDCRSVTEGWKLTARGASRRRDGRRAQALALAARPTAGQCCLVILHPRRDA
jgi:hypothetical protein